MVTRNRDRAPADSSAVVPGSPGGARRTTLLRHGVRLGLALGMVAAIVVPLRHTSLRALTHVFAGSDLTLLALSAPAVLALNTLLRAARFHVLLADRRGRRAPFREVLASVLVSQAANNVLPLRAGDLIRTRDFLVRGYSLASVASAQFVEKAVELAGLIAITSPLASRLPVGQRSGAGTVLIVVSLIAIIGWLAWRLRSVGGTGTFATRAGRGIADLVRALLWSISADGAELVLIRACLASLHLDAGWIGSLAVLAGINVALAVPAAPGNLGSFEAGATFGLVLAGVPLDQAVPFALLYRIVQWVPQTLGGGLVASLRRRHREVGQDVGSSKCDAVA